MVRIALPRASAFRRAPALTLAVVALAAASLTLPGAARAGGPPAAGIKWTTSLLEARAAAEKDGKVVFIAINMDGERANDTLAKEVYRDKSILALAAETVNLVVSAAQHGTDECPRFGGITCAQHQDVEIKVRHGVLNVTTGPVIAPQHVFLGPDGKLLLSVPYEVRVGELEWCFHEARRLVEPTYVAKPSAKCQKPLRLVIAGVDQVAKNAPLPRELALQRIAELRKGVGKHHEIIYELATADEPEAQDELRKFLRQGSQIGADGSIGTDWRPPLVRWIGVVSPQSYWELLADFVGSGEINMRREAIVAMEQLAAPEGLPELMKQLRKEKDKKVTGSLLRAIGACGAKDAKVRAALLKATRDKDEFAERSALLALGYLEPNEDVHACLAAALAEGDELARAAAAVAMGVTRDAHWIPVLEPLVAEHAATPVALKATCAAAVEVLRGAPYERLKTELARVADDGIPRARLFGGA